MQVKVKVTLLSVFLAYATDVAAGGFPCPDEHSRQLYATVQKLSAVHPLSKAESGYSTVIREAAKRQMDDISLHRACFLLAGRTFRTNCTDYGYECPGPGDDYAEWPAQINDWIEALKANVPVLQSCPDVYIRRPSRLPVVRAVPILPPDIVDKQITGWVVLQLSIDEFGKVASAGVASSTSSLLEEPVLSAARRFQYQPELDGDRYVPITDVRAVIFFHYWDLAQAAGCPVDFG